MAFPRKYSTLTAVWGANAGRLLQRDAALSDMMDYLRQDGVRVAAFDATNSTFERRSHVLHKLTEAKIGCKRMFLESICDNDDLLEENKNKYSKGQTEHM
mgnify:CR=1 FL=1